jgi:hypothetical protein
MTDEIRRTRGVESEAILAYWSALLGVADKRGWEFHIKPLVVANCRAVDYADLRVLSPVSAWLVRVGGTRQCANLTLVAEPVLLR